MLTTLQSRLKRAGRWLPVAMLPLLPLAARAQNLGYSPANATNVAGTYTDLGTTGAAITTTSTDDANSAAQNIGFTFNYNRASFTQFVLNTNGFIKLGATAPSAVDLFLPESATATQTDPISSTSAADVNIIAPFNFDLTAGSAAGGTEYRVTTTGTAPNRVCTIQWKNVADKTLEFDLQYSSMNFQVKLYETTNVIEFVYGTTTQGSNPDDFRYAVVGLKGSAAATGQALVADRPSSAALWSTTTFLDGFYDVTSNFYNYRGTVRPDVGRTYRFAPTIQPTNDIAVSAVYSLGRVSATYGSPVVAQALVTNNSATTKTAIPVTLTVSGATTFTNTTSVATLAAGASTLVTFTGYPIIATSGTNTLTVTVPADDVTTNNTGTASQTITAAEHSYIQGTTYTGGVGLPLAGNILAVRYTTTSATATVSTITPTFVGATAAGVTSTYQVLIYSAGTTGQPGTLLYTSPVQTRPTISGTTTATAAPVSIPGIAVSGSFFVALKTIGADNIGIGYQTEVPLRAGTFFFTTNAGTSWTDLNSQTISPRLALDVTFGSTSSTCAPVTNVAVGSITNTTASLTFTAPTGATGYIVTVTPAGGAATTITPAPTASPVSLTGLTAGTAYTVSVTNNCGTGSLSTAVTTTFTTTGGTSGPANDNCATATALTPGTTCTNILTTNAGATASTGAPAPGSNCFLATTPISNDVWYSVVVPTGGSLTITTSSVTGSPVTDTGLLVYSGTCGNLTEVGCSDDISTTNTFSSAVLTGLTPGATLYVRVWSFGTTPTGQFNICATTPPANDAAVLAVYSLGKVSSAFTSPVAVSAVVRNSGSTALTNLPVTLTVSGATTYTNTQTVASLAAGASTTVTFAAYPVTGTTGTNTLTVTIPADAVLTNNTSTFTQTISSADLSYVSGTTFAGGAGLATAGSIIAVGYRTAGPAAITSVTPSFAGTASSATATYQVLIYSASATTGQPGTVLYTSPARVRPVGAAGTIVTDVVTVPSIAVNGAFFVALKSVGADNLSIAYQTEVPLRGGTFFFTTTNGATWTDINTSTLNSRLAVDVSLSVVTAVRNEALAATVNLYPNPAHQSFQLSVPAGSLTKAAATLTNTLGQVVLKRQLSLPAAGGAADFNVSSLAPGVYSLTLKSGDDLVVKRVVVE